MTIEELYQERLAGHPRFGTTDQLEYLHDLVLALDAEQVMEIGVNRGGSTCAFLAALELTGGRLWSCDKKPAKGEIAAFLDHPQWRFVQAEDTVALDMAPQTCDVLLCDATTETAGLLWQLENYGPRVRAGGYLLVHDSKAQMVRDALAAYGAPWEERAGRRGMAVISIQ